MNALEFSIETNYQARRRNFFEKKYLPIVHYPQLINFLEAEGSLKLSVFSAYRLYGYEIKGGGTISKSPRFRTQKKAEAEAIKLLIKMLDIHFRKWNVNHSLSQFR